MTHALAWIGNDTWYPVSYHNTREAARAALDGKPERVRRFLWIATVREIP